MVRRARRLRGATLRVVRAKVWSAAIGAVMVATALVLWLRDDPWETWITDGLGLVCGATGAALLLASLTGRQPDWVEPE